MRFTDMEIPRTSSGLNFVDLFLKLIGSKGIKYSDFNQRGSCRGLLENKAGIYHFFSIKDNKVTSLYIGKGGYGKNGKWDLYKRLNQHKQPSQQDTIHGAIAREYGVLNSTAIQFLSDGNIYIQFVIVNDKYDSSNKNGEGDIKDLEDYCKYRLNPKYTDR